MEVDCGGTWLVSAVVVSVKVQTVIRKHCM